MTALITGFYQALKENTSEDGGLAVHFRLPRCANMTQRLCVTSC